jgi:hypothetical protein
MKMHPSLTAERIEEAARRQMFDLDSPGFCKGNYILDSIAPNPYLLGRI